MPVSAAMSPLRPVRAKMAGICPIDMKPQRRATTSAGRRQFGAHLGARSRLTNLIPDGVFLVVELDGNGLTLQSGSVSPVTRFKREGATHKNESGVDGEERHKDDGLQDILESPIVPLGRKSSKDVSIDLGLQRDLVLNLLVLSALVLLVVENPKALVDEAPSPVATRGDEDDVADGEKTDYGDDDPLVGLDEVQRGSALPLRSARGGGRQL